MSNEVFQTYGNDPVSLCREWLAEATRSELNDPEAACLATCDADGQPSARMILIKEISEQGFKFHTNTESQKGRDMAENAKAALCLYWKSTRRQIRIEGPVEPVSAAESDTYFATRPRTRQIGAWASRQSEAFEKREELEEAVKKYEQKFADKDVPRPPSWQGYRLKPERIEFWIASEHRLHTRFVYVRTGSSLWTATWLYP